MKIGERIRELRRELGVSRKELCLRSRIPYPTLAGIENGDQAATTRLHAIAAALGVSPSWLETGKGAREPVPADLLVTLEAEVDAMRAVIAALCVATAESRQREAREIAGWLSDRFPEDERPRLIQELIGVLAPAGAAASAGKGS